MKNLNYPPLPNHKVENGEALILFENHLHLVLPIVNGIVAKLPQYVQGDDDWLLNTGRIGLWRAVEKYEPIYGGFSAFARMKIRGAVLDELRNADPLSRQHRKSVKDGDEAFCSISLDESACDSDEDTMSSVIGDDGPNPYDCSLLLNDITLITDALRCLNPQMRGVIERYFFDDIGLKEIGQEIGVTESRVCQIKNQALALLRFRIKQKNKILC